MTQYCSHDVHLSVSCRGMASRGADLFHNDCCGAQGHTGATIFFRDQGSQKTCLSQRIDKLGRIAMRVVFGTPVGIRKVGADASNGFSDFWKVFAQLHSEQGAIVRGVSCCHDGMARLMLE